MIVVPREVKGFDGVAWGYTAQVKLPGGPMFHEIQLNTNAVAADIVLVELYVNGDPRISLTGEQLDMLEKYKKQYTETGKFVIPLADLFGVSMEGRAMSGLNTVPSDNLILKVKLGDGTASGGGTANLSAVAWVSNTSGNTPIAAYIPRLVSLTAQAGASGRNILDTIRDGIGRGAMIRRIHFDGRAGAGLDIITELRIRRNRAVEYEQTNADNRYQLKRKKLAPQAGFYHFDPVQSGFIRSDMFSTAGETLDFELTVSQAATIPMLVEAVELAA